MTKINLLPPEKIKRRKPPAERSYVWVLVVLPLVVIGALAFWYFSMNSAMNKKEKELQQAKTELADWQAKNQQLQQYKLRQEQIVTIEQTAVKALQGRVYWARILNEIAIMCPTDIWLTSLSGSSPGSTASKQTASGTVAFEGYAIQCPNRIFGRMFYPYYPDYRPIAHWLERMAQIIEFQRIWLSNAEPVRIGGTRVESGQVAGGTWLIRFSSQATLNMQTAAIGPTPEATVPAANPAPQTQPSTSGAETK